MKNYFKTMVGLACVAIIGLLIVMKPSVSKGVIQETREKPAPPTVSVESQSGSPLKMIVTSVNSTDPLKPEIEYSLVNTGQKVIRAYAVRHAFITPHSKFTSSDCQVSRASTSFLQPGQTTYGSMNNSGSNETITSIILTVDVVEFDDGEYWGPNLTNARDLINGMHSGMKAAVGFYQQKKEKTNLEGIARNLTHRTEQDTATSLPLPENKSPEWNKGYKNGIASISARLTQAYNNYGIEELDNELSRAARQLERR